MKKFLSLLLALAMVLTMCVIPAFAEEVTDDTEAPEVSAEPASVVYFVGDAQEGEAVEELLSGEAYLPDRMPEAETEEGKYFVGWADAEGNLVGKDGLTLAAGENKLTAVYASFAAKKEVNLQNHTTTADEAYIGYMKNGEYYGYVTSRTSGSPITEYIVDEENGESYLEVRPNADNAGGTAFVLSDANGAAIQGKWDTNYQIVVEYRIPENDNAMSIRANFGGKIVSTDSPANEAPMFRNQWGNEPGATAKLGNFWSVTAESALEKKWHDNGGYFYRFGDSVENAATTDGWKKVVFEAKTGAEDANYLPIFMVTVCVAGRASTQKFQIRSIKVIDTTVELVEEATVEYVVDGETVETVENLVAGEKFLPDVMPEAEAPEGKYFAGWKDSFNNWAGTEGFILEAGVNKLTAVYNDVVYYTTSSGDLVVGDANPYLAYPSYDPNGENFLNVVDATGNYLMFTSAVLDGEKVWEVHNKATWAARGNFLIPNADGTPMVIEPGETYTITMTYKAPDYSSDIYLSFAGGLGFTKHTGEYVDTRLGLNTPFQGIAKNTANFVSTTDPNLPSTSTGWTYIFTSNGHHQWAIQGASEEWQTVTFSLSTSADYTGFLPFIQGQFSMGGGDKFYVKEFTVKNASAVDPATVVVKANGEVEETFDNYKEGDKFVIDRLPNATAPEGKYFAGWMMGGKYVVDAAVLTAGENVIEAVYKDFVSGTVSADLKEATLPKTTDGYTKVILPTIVEDVYQNHVQSGGWTKTSDASDETGDFLKFSTTDTWGSNSLKVLRDADGAALMAKGETEYTINVTYRLGKYPETYTATWEDYQNGGARANMMMYVMVGFDPTIRNAFQNGNGQPSSYGKAVPQEHATWYDHGYGLGLWTDVCADGWVTETFKITTKSLEQYATDGYIPAFTLCTGVTSNSYEVHIKEVTISEHVHDFVANPDKDTVADCTNPGKFAYECECGEVKYEIDPEAPALGHGATKEVVTLEPQIGVAGSKDIVCLVCGNVIETVEIPALEDPGTSDEPTYIVGDVDGNGDVDAADLAVLKKVIAKLTPIDDPIVVNTDVDGNGEEIPDAADLAKLKKIIAKLD